MPVEIGCVSVCACGLAVVSTIAVPVVIPVVVDGPGRTWPVGEAVLGKAVDAAAVAVASPSATAAVPTGGVDVMGMSGTTTVPSTC